MKHQMHVGPIFKNVVPRCLACEFLGAEHNGPHDLLGKVRLRRFHT